jgi:hypothetical protein
MVMTAWGKDIPCIMLQESHALQVRHKGQGSWLQCGHQECTGWSYIATWGPVRWYR